MTYLSEDRVVTHGSMEAVFEGPYSTPEWLIEYTERLLFGDLSRHGETLWNLLKPYAQETNLINKYSFTDWISKEQALLTKLKADYSSSKNILPFEDETDRALIQVSVYSISAYQNGFYAMGSPYFSTSYLLASLDKQKISQVYYSTVREIVNALQSDVSKRKILYTEDLVGSHFDILEEYQNLNDPFSLTEYIKLLRSLCPENERPLDHDFTTDWERFFRNNPYPFFMVDENLSS